jgi:hypothetical protein
MTHEHPENEVALDRRLDEEREAGRTHRPLQAPATESAEESVDEQRRAIGSQEG